MKCLVITTLSEIDNNTNLVINSLQAKEIDTEVFNTNKYNIGNCIGCTNCWFKTPGVCAVKDDWEIVFKKFLKSDYLIFITETHLGFVSHKMKNIVDRIIPIATPYTVLHNGEMRHVKRYDKTPDMGLIYSGSGDKEFLSEWLSRVTLNFFAKSLGVYNIDESEEITNEFGDIQLFPKS